MGKKLAIKGHATRGNEVIGLLEMMGGAAVEFVGGFMESHCYYISEDTATKYISWDYIGPEEIDKYEIFTLEEFLEKYPFKVGDKVHVYVQNDDIDGRYDIEVAEITSMRWNSAIRKIAYKMKNINREFYKEEIKCKVDDSTKPTKTMGKKLAIKGHSTRGEEVIELLKMMGGKNEDNIFFGKDPSYIYFIDGYGFIRKVIIENNIHTMRHWQIFTLEEFLEKYPFKIGDKVYTKSNAEGTIIDIFWDGIEVLYQLSSANVNALGYFRTNELKPYKETDDMKLSGGEGKRTREDMIFDSIIWHLRNSVNNGKQNLSGGECEKYFREVVKKNNENKMKNVLAELLEHIKNTSKEELEKEFNELEEWSNVGPTVEEFRAFCERVNKKPKYPETYKECCDVLNLTWNKCFVMFDIDHNGLTDEENNLYESLIKLKRCRDAYWKIAGEEMGLGKPWGPDDDTEIYNIYRTKNTIRLGGACWGGNCNILEFPTEEMRDAFYENFKDLIEHCKELL